MNSILLFVQIYLVFTARWYKAFFCWEGEEKEELRKFDSDILVDDADDESNTFAQNFKNDDDYQRATPRTKQKNHQLDITYQVMRAVM